MNQTIKTFFTLILGALLAFSVVVNADSHTKNKLVIQVSTDDARTQRIALNNAVNLQKQYGLTIFKSKLWPMDRDLACLPKKADWHNAWKASRCRTLLLVPAAIR